MRSLRRPGYRALGFLVMGSLLVGSAAGAEAATKKKKVVKHTRVVTLKYTGACTVAGNTPAVTFAFSSSSCPPGAADYSGFDAQPGEKYLTVKVTDSTGRPVHGELWLTTGSGTAANDKNQEFCGALTDYLLTQRTFSLDLDAATVDASCPGGATSGTITATWSNLP
jgi:hypothetical protein